MEQGKKNKKNKKEGLLQVPPETDMFWNIWQIENIWLQIK